jgi:hypothetical protein
MTARPGGTFAVDGLIEGPMPEVPGARRNLEDWSALLRKTGIRMSLEVDGSRFSLLPDPTPVPRATVGPTPSRTLRDSLQQLLDAFPPAHRAAVFSTLRSAEVDGGVEVQTAYLVGRDGRVEVQDRTVEAAPGIPRTEAPRWTRALLFGFLLLAALVVSSLLVDYRAFLRDLWSSATPLSLPDSTVDPGAFAPWLSARIKTVDGRSRAIGVELSRTNAFPKSAPEIEAALAAPGLSLDARLALNAIATGYVRCELADETGAFLDVAMLRVRELASADSVVRTVVVPPGVRPRRLVLAP